MIEAMNYLGDDSKLESYLLTLPKHRLDALTKKISYAREFKYPRVKDALYGGLPRCFNKEQLVFFLSSISDPEFLRACLLVTLYGLRAGELNTVSVVPNQGLVCIHNSKGSRGRLRYDYLPLLPGSEFLFKPFSWRDKHCFERRFRKHCSSLGGLYNNTYGSSLLGRPLYQFTAHSLRHTSGNLFREFTRDPFKTAVFLRHRTHKLFGSTAFYMHYSLDDMKQDMVSLFSEFLYIHNFT